MVKKRFKTRVEGVECCTLKTFTLTLIPTPTLFLDVFKACQTLIKLVQCVLKLGCNYCHILNPIP